MFARVLAVIVVLALTGPSVVAATCELTCALASHHHGTPSPAATSCHGHESSTQGSGVNAGSSALCHDSGVLPTAVVDAAVSALAAYAALPTAILLAHTVGHETIARVSERCTPLDPPPAFRPLRV
jgi:hypothetical protein